MPSTSRSRTLAAALTAVLLPTTLAAPVVAGERDTAADPPAAVRAADGTHLATAATGPDDQLVADAQRSGRLIVTTGDGDHLVREVAAGDDVEAVVDATLATPGVVAVEADQLVRTATELTATELEVLDPEAWRQWHLGRIGATATHAAGVDGDEVVVAVLDTGVQATHPDLAGNVLPGYDAVARRTVATSTDSHGHGTLVAGTVAAVANDLGGRGVAHRASILPVTVLDAAGNGSVHDVAHGLDWAVANGADIVNLSLAGEGTTTAMNAAIVRAVDAGVVVVAASGNLATEGNPTMWPAAHPDTIAVGATRKDGNGNDAIAPFSGHGDHLTVAAPGVGILSTALGGGYVTWQGTSAATPVAAGALASAIQAGEMDLRTRAHVTALTGQLTATAEDLGAAGFDRYFGHGLVRVDDLVAEVSGLELAPVDTPPPPAGDDGDQVAPPDLDEPAPKDPAPKDPVPKDPVALPPFTDVPADNVHLKSIDRIRLADITQGCGDGIYCPSGRVTRGQMATFLAKARGLELQPYRGRFRDVPADHTHARAIEALARAGITGGCGDDRYCPGADVRRDQMATFLTNAYRLPVPSKRQVFADVTGGVHRANVAAVRAAKVTLGCGGDRYCPSDSVRRDQMASFLTRAMDH